MILAALLGCASTGASPLGAITRTPEAPDVDGTVAEVVPAGGYAYLRVDERWYATFDRGLAVGDTVVLDPIGRAEGFYSRRTGLTFDTLWFASVVSRESSADRSNAASSRPARRVSISAM